MADLNEYRCFMQKEELHKALNTLNGIMEGITADGVVDEKEFSELSMWYSLHEHMRSHPFSEIMPRINDALSDGVLDIEEVEDILWLCKRFADCDDSKLYFDAVTSDMQTLQGILHGILSDNELSDREIAMLNDWLNDHDYLCGTYPFDEIYGLLLAAKEDGVISEDERNMLKAFFTTFIDATESYNIHQTDVKELQERYSIGGICSVCPEIVIPGKVFCFTGESARAKRDEIADIIREHGGEFIPNVSRKIDYLIVGADGNPCWAFSCYGRKVEKAMELRKKGAHIVIVHENDFWDEI